MGRWRCVRSSGKGGGTSSGEASIGGKGCGRGGAAFGSQPSSLFALQGERASMSGAQTKETMVGGWGCIWMITAFAAALQGARVSMRGGNEVTHGRWEDGARR